MGNPNTKGQSDKLAFKKDVVYIHHAKPRGLLNTFQAIIQKVQKAMGFTKWESTHVFTSYNNKIIDRTGAYTVTSDEDAQRYLKEHYSGYEINSYGSDDEHLTSNFNSLYKKISTTKVKPIFVEDPFTGEYFCADTVPFQPYNSLYGFGKETTLTIKEAYNLVLKGVKVSEDKAIISALGTSVDQKFKDSSKLKNPTYCSLTIGELMPSLQGLTILRYPALAHAFLDTHYKRFNMSYIKTIID